MKIRVQRAMHTVNGYVFTGVPVEAELITVAADNEKGRNPYAVLQWPNGSRYYFRVNSGWGEKPVKSYRIEAKALQLIQELAKEKRLKVKPVDAPPHCQARRHEAPEGRAEGTGDVVLT